MSGRGFTGARRRSRLNARNLNRRITMRSVIRTPDGGGGYTEALVDMATVWAHVHPLTGREQILAQQTDETQTHRFTIRYRTDLTTATRIRYDDRDFDITSIADSDERHRELVIMAEALN